MARYYGSVGYGISSETSPGVWEDMIVEYKYKGDVIRNTRTSKDGEYLSNDLTVGNSISIVADAYARNNFASIRYVVWSGQYWIVTQVEVQHPRLILRLGGVYHGPKS